MEVVAIHEKVVAIHEKVVAIHEKVVAIHEKVVESLAPVGRRCFIERPASQF